MLMASHVFFESNYTKIFKASINRIWLKLLKLQMHYLDSCTKKFGLFKPQFFKLNLTFLYQIFIYILIKNFST